VLRLVFGGSGEPCGPPAASRSVPSLLPAAIPRVMGVRADRWVGRGASRDENGCVQSPTPSQEDHPVDRLSAVLGQAVQFVYTCWDRIVLSGYIERLQRPENLLYFFHNVVGIDTVEPAVLEQRITQRPAHALDNRGDQQEIAHGPR
jgi:hypothetical protein